MATTPLRVALWWLGGEPHRIAHLNGYENSFVSETITKLKEDRERVSTQLGRIKQQLAHLAEVLPNGGMSIISTVKEKLEALDAERAELEESKARLKTELDAEESQEIAVDAHVKSLALFDRFVAEHADEPERVKSIITRFID